MKIKFQKKGDDFQNALTNAVENYFKTTGLKRKDHVFIYFKTIFFFTAFLISYLMLLFGGYGLLTINLLWISVGLNSVFLAVNCGHDAIHGAYSSKRWINSLMANSYNLLGANAYLWSIQHNIVHHTYTNIHGADEDIEAVPFVRFSPEQKWRPIQRYQHVWVLILYSMGTLSWVFRKDYKKFFQKKIGIYDNKNHPKIQYFYLFFHKVLYYIIFLAVPLMMIEMAWPVIIGGFILMHLFEGFTVAVIFALAHVVEEVNFPKPDEEGYIHNSWAIHQLYTTANFGRKSFITSFLCGGLNFQIEHHLFPHICHVHYPAISNIVKIKAQEYGVPYYEFPSFLHALKSHIRYLKKLGNNNM